VDTEEGADAAVGPGQLHGHQAGRDLAEARAAVSLDGPAGHAQLSQLGHQLEGELGPLPVIVDDRQHLLVAEAADPVANLPFPLREEIVDPIEIQCPVGVFSHHGIAFHVKRL
jgi:hypothetical protein